jgi:hypothetical protein
LCVSNPWYFYALAALQNGDTVAGSVRSSLKREE